MLVKDASPKSVSSKRTCLGFRASIEQNTTCYEVVGDTITAQAQGPQGVCTVPWMMRAE